ncbi:hypothetical protein MKX01_010116 [Papaver californicum]|nr:hypothetical protein MKX01_010116 [Papaver californicum]
MGYPLMTATYDTNPWWGVFNKAIVSAGGTLFKPEILASITDACYMREILKKFLLLGSPFSPMTNNETFCMREIKIYESVIRKLLSFEGGNQEST